MEHQAYSCRRAGAGLRAGPAAARCGKGQTPVNPLIVSAAASKQASAGGVFEVRLSQTMQGDRHT